MKTYKKAVICRPAPLRRRIRKFFVSRIMVDDEYKESVIGTPQGGSLSALLANIMLTVLIVV